MKTLSFAAVLVLLGIVPLASAQDEQRSAGPSPEELFGRLDANQDGAVTGDEIPERQKRFLDRVVKAGDKNGDGKLDKEEFVAGLKAGREQPQGQPTDQARPDQPRPAQGLQQFNPEQLFKRLDTNGDGKITKDDEVPERAQELVKRADADKDGTVTKEELAKMPRPNQARQPGQPGQNNRPGGGQNALFAALDADKDGRVSSLELAEAAKALEKLDRNGDEYISREEAAGGPQRDAASRPATEGDPKRVFASLDKDGDGKLNKDEAPERIKEAFDRLDANADGGLDAEEMQKMINRLRKGEGAQAQGAAKRPQAQ